MTQPHLDQLSADKWLRDRRLVTISEDEAGSLALLTDPDYREAARLDGLILTGATATETARRLRLKHPAIEVLVELHATAKEVATAESPFVLPTGGLFETSLAELVADRLANGDTYALTPTGYLTVIDPDALRAVIQQANAIDTDRLIVTIPIESGWLKSTHRQQLIAILNGSRHPLLVSLGANGEPLDSIDKAEGLVSLVTQVENISFTRADHLVGMEVLARSSGSVAFGTIPSRRRTTPPGQSGFASDKTERRPHVYYPTLHRFIRGWFAGQLFANTPPPPCGGVCCDGQALDEFRDTPEDHVAAMNHNMTSLLARSMAITGTHGERLDALQQLYVEAEAEHRRVEALIARTLAVPKDQHRLGQLSGGVPATVRTASR
jgi:hypothetical protein